MNQIHFIDPIVVVPNGVQPVDGILGSIGSFVSKVGSKIGTVASKVGKIFKSPVMSKLLEGGIALGGSLLLAKATSQKGGLLPDPTATAGVYAPPTTYTPPAKSNTTKYLLYGGAALAAIAVIVLVTNRRRR